MSLATRCVACGTIFRVVQDQLKVSEGWVRCGRCDEVFNALEGLFDLDNEPPPRWTAPTAVPAADTADAVVIEPPAPLAQDAPFDDHVIGDPAGIDADRIEPPFFEPDPAGVVFSPSPALVGRPREPVDEAPESVLPIEGEPAEAEPDAPAAAMPFTPMPAFVARADRDALWRRPGRLAGMSALVLLLVAMLAGQAANHFHDTLAARWPAARAPLEHWCGLAGCRIAPPLRIEDIVVENTGLTRAVAGTDTYRLAVTLRNRGGQPLAMPFVDLTLTDNAGQLVARRALSPADFQRPAATIAANADLPLQALIATGNAKVSGYTVEIFYP